ncbi:MAG: hypothetical protein HZB53_08875 [Chloroflexi bacterium]|nr:hypothetical protein [Chloroflexota bacterium]
MTNLHDAIETYHGLLTDDVAAESDWQLDDQHRRRGLFFGSRKMCTVLRPRFLTTAQYRRLQNAISAVMPAFDRAYRAALADPNVRAQFGLADWEEELIRIEPRYAAPSPTARMDSFYLTDDGTIAFTEYNAEVPAAAAYNESLTEIFYGMRIMREFEKQYEVVKLPARHHTMHALLDSYRQWGGRERPNIAILDWREVPTYSEFVLFNDYFASQGYESRIVDPREVEYRNGKLMAGTYHITLIYKRVLITELIERCGIDGPVVQAVRDGAVCMVNSFRCKILHRKTSLAVLSDERNAHLFTPAQRQAIDATIPWTRLLAERRAVIDGAKVDLLPYLSARRNDFVLKPSDEYGGKGIVLGWTVDQTEWEAKLKEYLSSPTIVQKRVTLPSEPFPSFVDGQVDIYDRMLDTNPYIWYGNYMSGCLTRISTAALLNVTAGGGSTVPTFVIEQRD